MSVLYALKSFVNLFEIEGSEKFSFLQFNGVQGSFEVTSCARGPPLWSSGHSSGLLIQRSRVRFPALPDFLNSSGSGTGSTQPS
jgi:hypothetical protein